MKNIKGYGDILNEGSKQDDLNRDLRYSAMYASVVSTAYTLDRGAEIDSVDPSTGETALHFAAINRDETMIKMLLHRGADPNIEDKRGYTPLKILMKRRNYMIRPVFVDLVKLFIGYGADPLKAFDGPRDVFDFFRGDISWMPKGLREKITRMNKVRSVFGK